MIILLFPVLTGWMTGWLIIKLLFWPLRPVRIGSFEIAGFMSSGKSQFAKNAGKLLQEEIRNYKGLDEKMADPQLIAKLRPEIEQHIDHFLQVKLKAIFPVISQFMGEKTINQFKTALLTEIDSLLPELLKKYASSIKEEFDIGAMVEERIHAIPVSDIRKAFYERASKQIMLIKLAGAGIGLVAGSIAVLLVTLAGN